MRTLARNRLNNLLGPPTNPFSNESEICQSITLVDHYIFNPYQASVLFPYPLRVLVFKTLASMKETRTTSMT